MLCGHLEGWDGEGWRGGRGYGDVCVHVADSLRCAAEANTALCSSCTPVEMLKKKKVKKKKCTTTVGAMKVRASRLIIADLFFF